MTDTPTPQDAPTGTAVDLNKVNRILVERLANLENENAVLTVAFADVTTERNQLRQTVAAQAARLAAVDAQDPPRDSDGD